MSNPNTNTAPDLVCPLATDADGNPVALPEGASAWRIRRHTGGRPRIQLGADKQPMEMPLSYTLADLEDILPPGAYRLDLVDAKGDPLGLTKRFTIGQLRNADDESGADDEATPSMIPTASSGSLVSDARFVLEANVRSTQLAFQHNQRTLELALRTAETLREGVHVLAESQADWIKSIASSRGFFRNAQPQPQLPAPTPKPDDGDEDDEEEESAEPAKPAAEQDWIAKASPLVAIVVQQVVSTLADRFSGAGGGESKIQFGDLFDWRRPAQRANENRAPKAATGLPPTTPAKPSLAELLATLPPAVFAKLMHVRGMLSADEQQRAMQLIGAFDPADMEALTAQIESMPAEQLAEFLRAQIAKAAA